MKVLLLNPPPKRVLEKKDVPRYQHIGIGYLVSAVEEAGHDVKVIDAKLDRMSPEKVIEEIEAYSPDILGVSAMTHEIETAAFIVREYKKIDKTVNTILGGVHITALPEETLKRYMDIDAGIIGEGERALPRIIKVIESGSRDFSDIPGVVYRDKLGQIRQNESQWIEDLDSLPRPNWRYFKNAKDYIIITSRGCPYSCVFCMQASGKKVRRRSGYKVIEEIERVIEEKKPERFLFYDETFTLDKKKVYEICDSLIKKGLNKSIKWSATTRVDAVDRDMLIKMKEAGCDHIEFGVESGNEEMLKRIKKGITKSQAENAIKLAKELGFHTEAAFILGHPHENMETALETINFAAMLNPNVIQLGIMVPYPGTEVREMALRNEGGYKILSEDWTEYNKQLGNAVELEELSRADLERLQLAGYLRLFFHNRRYLDVIKFVFNFWREALSYLKNISRKRGKTTKPRISYWQVLNFIFTGSYKKERVS